MASYIHRPFIPLVLTLILGILGGKYLGNKGLILDGILIAICAGYLLFNITRDKPSRFAPLILFFLLGHLSLLPFTRQNFPPHHITHHLNQYYKEINGIIDDKSIHDAHLTKLILRIECLKISQMSMPVSGRVIVTVLGHLSGVSIGDRVQFSGKIHAIRNFNNPNSFDYKSYMAYKQVYGRVYVHSNHMTQLGRPPQWPWMRMYHKILQHTRENITRIMDRAMTSPKAESILEALILGNKSHIPADLKSAFQKIGIGHLLAISGLHIGIIASIAYYLIVFLLKRIRPLLWHAQTRKFAAILAIGPVLSYGILAGMSPSTQRAVIMVIIFLFSSLLHREHDLMNTIACAGLLMLLIDPPAIFSISFQLSFAAVISITAGIGIFSGTYTFHPTLLRRFRTKCLTFLLVTIFAILGTLPLCMRYFNQISIMGIFTNLIFVPLIGYGVIPLGLCAVLVFPFFDPLARLCFQVSDMILVQAIDLIYAIADTPFSHYKTITPDTIDIFCYYSLFLMSLAFLNLKGKKNDNDNNLFLKFSNRGITLALIILIVFLGNMAYKYYDRFYRRDLRITIIDVGQGSSALVELPQGKCVLIDGGGFSDRSSFDVGEKILAPLLWAKNIKTIDLVILSHSDYDHLNGLLYIAEHFCIHTFWSNGEYSESHAMQKFQKILEKKRIFHPRFHDIHRKTNINGVLIDILYPPEYYDANICPKQMWRNTNNDSIVVKITYENFSILFPGDIMKTAEQELILLGKDNLKSTVLVAPHHGSKTSSTPSFIDAVAPQVAIFSAGWTRRSHFPPQTILERYQSRGYQTYFTYTHGAITIHSNGKKTIITTPQNSLPYTLAGGQP